MTKNSQRAFNKGHLGQSQSQGVICLIPKQDKDSKVSAKMLKVTPSEIINPDQIGSMQNCLFGENIRLINDINDYCTSLKNPCFILLVDFKKAFDK